MRRSYRNSYGYGSSYGAEEDVDPRTGLVNLADVMLVFACGLMVALVAHWNVNLTEVSRVDETAGQEIEDMEDTLAGIQSGDGRFKDRGRVYQDPETGQLYMLEDVGEADGDGAAASGSSGE